MGVCQRLPRSPSRGRILLRNNSYQSQRKQQPMVLHRRRSSGHRRCCGLSPAWEKGNRADRASTCSGASDAVRRLEDCSWPVTLVGITRCQMRDPDKRAYSCQAFQICNRKIPIGQQPAGILLFQASGEHRRIIVRREWLKCTTLKGREHSSRPSSNKRLSDRWALLFFRALHKKNAHIYYLPTTSIFEAFLASRDLFREPRHEKILSSPDSMHAACRMQRPKQESPTG